MLDRAAARNDLDVMDVWSNSLGASASTTKLRAMATISFVPTYRCYSERGGQERTNFRCLNMNSRGAFARRA